MKIKVEYIDTSETLIRSGNMFFTKTQLKEIERA